ncbi:hypothetical protein C7974DRAFT_64595 [Boeremia exigua]|uniref:uncharacterized protein n=1 Tax=Boeremia exigua TaxID=749465 RepID=UPI001E8E07AE|nr:uncharacterized protein C7974DRAFT_64595 [Boeremia exigua]KAH6615351.1 hypothetical protein C7974DRAFT_64595 [Boeremia exigua]
MALEGLQKRTFLPYLRGVFPEELRLGSLYINPLEPTDGLASLRWEFMGDEDDQDVYEKVVSKWTRKRAEIDQPFSIEFEASKARSLGFNFTDFLGLNATKTKESMVKIHGQSGRRMKIKNPEKFLEEVMQQPGVQEWIREHASIEHKSKYGRHIWRAPKIWMVTGVQHVTGGAIDSTSTRSTTLGGAAGLDPSAAAHAPPGTLKLGANVDFTDAHGATTNFGHADERVWAAQFMPVSIVFGPDEDRELSAKEHAFLPKTIAHFRLDDVPDLEMKGIREDDFVIDDAPYVENRRETDWEQYDKYKRWLKEVDEDE